MEELFKPFLNFSDLSCVLNGEINESDTSAAILYLRILACGIIVSVSDEIYDSGVDGTENPLLSKILPILMKTGAAILDQDQRKLVITLVILLIKPLAIYFQKGH